ncbi:hypothetical protein [Halobacillus sp. Marseille-Q1614]|uniref:hypothetical protein n=1 Tax=Halobacillus sp. Marseille-Q1614 TaxID=2709134 RepID=UPI00156F9D5A|nr:hypothetical protein [Halobacillus sp. Marseille-Q1614]
MLPDHYQYGPYAEFDERTADPYYYEEEDRFFGGFFGGPFVGGLLGGFIGSALPPLLYGGGYGGYPPPYYGQPGPPYNPYGYYW